MNRCFTAFSMTFIVVVFVKNKQVTAFSTTHEIIGIDSSPLAQNDKHIFNYDTIILSC